MKDDLVFDIGMHKGEDTAFYLKKGYRVVAIEADPDLAAMCRKRFQSHIESGSLHIIEGAIVGKDEIRKGTIKFYKNQRSIWGTTEEKWRDRNARLGAPSIQISVPCLDLEAVLKEHGVPHYMKIDIEGADRTALKYLRGLDERPRYISVESEKVSFQRLEGEIDLLCQLGYRKFRAVEQAIITAVPFKGQTRSGERITHQFENDASGPFGADLDAAGKWMTREELLVEYKWIFQMYELFGDESPFSRDQFLVGLKKRLEQHFKRALPGWYDTHATS